MFQSPGTRWSAAAAALAGAALLLLGSWAAGFVNPNFTPKHLERDAASIFTVRITSIDADNKGAALEVLDVIKGKQEARKLRLDCAAALAAKDGPTLVEDFIGLLKAAGTRPALVAAGEFEGKPCALMHVEACWVRLNKGKDAATWDFDRADSSLNGTFNGGTDMFIETMCFIRKFPSAPIMPVSGGVDWTEHLKLGTLAGKAVQILAADANGDGRLDVFAACPQGDKLFVQDKEGKFAELAATGSASLAAAWADFDGDGRPDLASLTKDGLKVYFQKEPGKFTAADVPGVGKVETASPTLGIADLEPDGKPDLVVGAGTLPVVLKNDGQGGFGVVVLPFRLEFQSVDRGIAGPCVVADFDADGFADIVQTFQKGGVLWRGKAGGFEAPVDCGALMGKVKWRRPLVADLDGDGLLDILLIGGDSTPFMLQNRGGAKFEEVMRLTGESGYIIQPGATCAALGDYNNDTFVDIFAGYEEEPCQFFFNRGFRSFAINEPLKLKAEDLEGADKGQAAAIWADLGGTGALELVTALANGDVYLSRSNLGAAEKPLFVRVPFPAEARSAGPLVVRFYLEGRCLGARVADRWSGPALLGVPEAGTYAIKYKLPDGKEVAREAEAGEEAKPPGKPTVGTQGAKPTGASPAPVRRPTPAPGTEASGLSGGALALIAGLVALVMVIIIVVMVKSRKEKGP